MAHLGNSRNVRPSGRRLKIRMCGQIAALLAMAALMGLCGCRSVTLTSRPSNADVFNDYDVLQGVTPLYLGMLSVTKQYQVRKAGYLPQRVTVGPMSPATLDVVLAADSDGAPEKLGTRTALRKKGDTAAATHDVVHAADSDAVREKLGILTALRRTGDITEEEYEAIRKRLLDALLVTAGSASDRPPDSGQAPSIPSQTAESRTAVPVSTNNTPPVGKPRFGITCRVVDDAAEDVAVIGNGDGRVQKGEVIDFVVVVTNIGDAAAQDIDCSMTLLRNKSVKLFSATHQVVASLAVGASTTFRYNLAIPLHMDIAPAPMCMIELKSAGTAAERYKYDLPIELP